MEETAVSKLGSAQSISQEITSSTRNLKFSYGVRKIQTVVHELVHMILDHAFTLFLYDPPPSASEDTSTAPHVFLMQWLIRHRRNFKFYFHYLNIILKSMPRK
jgi:hypothetical protein